MIFSSLVFEFSLAFGPSPTEAIANRSQVPNNYSLNEVTQISRPESPPTKEATKFVVS